VRHGKKYSGLNDYSLGIEVAGNGNRWEYSDVQFDALCEYVRKIKRYFPVLDDPNRWIGHQHITPPTSRGWRDKAVNDGLSEYTSLTVVDYHDYFCKNFGRKNDPGKNFDWNAFYTSVWGSNWRSYANKTAKEEENEFQESAHNLYDYLFERIPVNDRNGNKYVRSLNYLVHKIKELDGGK